MKILGFYQNDKITINTAKQIHNQRSNLQKSSPNRVQDHFLIEKRNITIRGKKISKYRGLMWKIIDFCL